MIIPKILHTIWIGNNAPSLDFRNSWKIFNDWKIIHWNDQTIKEEFGDNPVLMDLYNKEGPTIISDYARLIILQKYGGVYSDIDVIFLKSFNDLIKNIKSFLIYQFPYIPIDNRKKLTPKGLSLKEAIRKKINVYNMYNTDIYLNNNLIGTIPNGTMINTFIKVFEEDRLQNIKDRFSYIDYGAGPSMTTHVGNIFVKLNGYTQSSDQVTIFQSDIFHPTNYIQFKEQNYKREISNTIAKQLSIANNLGSYAVHLQASHEVESYFE